MIIDAVKSKDLKAWLRDRFGSLANASRQLGRSSGYFTSYTFHGAVPGVRILRELAPFGFDVDAFLQGTLGSPMPFDVPDEPHMVNPKLSEVWDRFAATDETLQSWGDLSDTQQQIVLLNVGKLCSELQIDFLSRMQ